MMTPEMMEQERKEFGRFVKLTRTRIAKMSVEEVATRAESVAEAVKSLEAGSPTIEYDEIARICRVLEIPVPIIYTPGIIF